MSFLKKLFGQKDKSQVPIKQDTTLVEGDIFYTNQDGEYHTYKLLKIEQDTFHVLGYEVAVQVPTAVKIPALKVQIYHFPIVSSAFPNATVIANQPVTDEDLSGYNYYLELTQDENNNSAKALEYYKQANDLADQKKYVEAIECYTKAIDLVNTFFEAIDNRAFCKMDLGQWQEAIQDFELSLSVKPNSILAEFSIGECYMRLGLNEAARTQFEKVLIIDPQHPAAKDFLLKVV